MRPEIDRAMGEWVIPGKRYHGPLPPELASWYVYVADGGHSIAVALEEFETEPPGRIEDRILPVPVRAVLRTGWWLASDGVPVVNLPYDRNSGLITEEADEEL